MDQFNYNRLSQQMGNEEGRGKKGGGCGGLISLVFCVLTGIYYFNVENLADKLGQPNYCVVDQDEGINYLRACAEAKYSKASVSCQFVFNHQGGNPIDVHEKFNLVLFILFIGWCCGIANGIVAALGCTFISKLLAIP